MELAESESKFFYGTPGAVRTRDPQLRRLVLYPLSYGRITAVNLKDMHGQVKGITWLRKSDESDPDHFRIMVDHP